MRLKQITFIYTLFLLSHCWVTFAQDTTFIKEIDLKVVRYHNNYSNLISTNDGGLLLAFKSGQDTLNGQLITLTKLNQEFDISWSIQINQLGSDLNIKEDLEGNILLSSNFGQIFSTVAKLDPYGNQIWAYKSLDQMGYNEVLAFSDCYFHVGNNEAFFSATGLDFMVSKFSSDGDLIWSKSYETSEDQKFQKVLKIDESKFLICAQHRIQTNSIHKGYFMMLDTSGAVIWSKEYSPAIDFRILSGLKTAGGEILLAGYRKDLLTGLDILFIRMNDDGELPDFVVYQNTYYEEAFGILETNSSDLILCTEPEIDHEGFGVDLQPETGFFRIDEHGEPIESFYFDISTEGSFPLGALPKGNGYVIVAQNKENSKIWLAKTDENGRVGCNEIDINFHPTYLTVNPTDYDYFEFSGVDYDTVSLEIIDLYFESTKECQQISIDTSNIPHYIPEIPNVFSPGSDDVNDLFYFEYPYSNGYIFTVINRWGEVVFESTQADHYWDGKNMNSLKPCPDGVYFYKLVVGELSKSGTLSLINE